MAAIGRDILKASKLLKTGNIVAIPTETVYGLAGNALRDDIVVKIFKAKNRPAFDPLICHTDSIDKIRQYVEYIPEEVVTLASAFWPGPLTVLLKKKPIVPSLTTSGLEEVAFRIPNHPLTLELLSTLDFPLAAPSANPFGYISPTTAKHVQDQLGNEIPYILDGGECEVGIESTIIGFPEGQPTVYRLGGKQVEEIEALIGLVQINLNQSSNPSAPGMMKSHYAPKKPVLVGNIARLIDANRDKRIGILSFVDRYPEVAAEHQTVLSQNSDLNEAARNLFGALRKLDGLQIDMILSEPFPDKGLGRAINDRLNRASAK
ncbi:MAG: L-threonylcarbamoyladenylate synthase [Cyclobacteriaceae bacterium]